MLICLLRLYFLSPLDFYLIDGSEFFLLKDFILRVCGFNPMLQFTMLNTGLEHMSMQRRGFLKWKQSIVLVSHSGNQY